MQNPFAKDVDNSIGKYVHALYEGSEGFFGLRMDM